MKRIGHLMEKVTAFENLLLAACKAMRGKRNKRQVARFFLELEPQLIEIQKTISAGTYRPQPYDCFHVHEPKQRYICAAHIRDRVVHHAICNVLEPVFERSFIDDSYACRRQKGAHRAVQRVQRFSRQARFFLKTDVEKCFESIDHSVLKQLLRGKIKDRGLLRLLDIIIDEPVPGYSPGKGLPIGNLTSQWWANFYLDRLDHFIKDGMGVKRYARYMDDLVIVEDEKAALHHWTNRIREFLDRRLALRLKEKATFIAPVSQGIPFVGVRIFPGLIRIKRSGLTRFRRRYRENLKAYADGRMDEARLIRSTASLIGHLQHADTWRMRHQMFHTLLDEGD